MNSSPLKLDCPAAQLTRARTAVPVARQKSVSVLTRMTVCASREKIWNELMFYEQIEKHPPLLLRLLLPIPIRTEGRKSEVGDEARCYYESGHLVKRVTQITPGWNYAFEVVEQRLALRRAIRLLGGAYMLNELLDGRTQVALETRYISSARPRLLCEWIEAAVCHCFHRHILDAMSSNLESRSSRKET